MAKFNIKKSLPTAAGLVVGGVATNYVKKIVPIENQTIKAAVPVVVGLLLMSQKSPIISGVGSGMVAVGGSSMLQSFGIGNAYQDEIEGVFEELDMEDISGTDEAIHGTDEAIHGTIDEELDY